MKSYLVAITVKIKLEPTEEQLHFLESTLTLWKLMHVLDTQAKP